MDSGRRLRHNEISAVCNDALRQLGEGLLDKRAHLMGLSINESRRDRGDHVLERGAVLQRKPPHPKLSPKINQNVCVCQIDSTGSANT
jgi:hypothetical protein